MNWIDDIYNQDMFWLHKDRFPPGFKMDLVYENPTIIKIRNFLSSEECIDIIKNAEGKYSRSTMFIDDKLTHNPRRTSQTSILTENGYKDGPYNKTLENLYKRVCILTGCLRNQLEGFMVVKYEEGQFFKEHVDYFDNEKLHLGGQRIATIFVYLNDMSEEDGGATYFPKIGLKSIPELGSALFWWNKDHNGMLEKTSHIGEKVNKGIKYGLNIWIRYPGF